MPYIVGMDVVTGTDTSASSAGVDRLLGRHPPPDRARRRRQRRRDDLARARRASCCRCPAPRRCTSTTCAAAAHEEELVGRLPVRGRRAAQLPAARAPSARRASAGWRARGSSFLAADADELAASVPRLAATGRVSCALLLPLAERGEVEAVVMLVRRRQPRSFARAAVELARRARRSGRDRARARARARRGRHRRGHRLHEPPRDAPAPGRGDRPRRRAPAARCRAC